MTENRWPKKAQEKDFITIKNKRFWYDPDEEAWFVVPREKRHKFLKAGKAQVEMIEKFLTPEESRTADITSGPLVQLGAMVPSAMFQWFLDQAESKGTSKNKLIRSVLTEALHRHCDLDIKADKTPTPFSVSLTPAHIKWIEKNSKGRGLNKSEFMRQVLDRLMYFEK